MYRCLNCGSKFEEPVSLPVMSGEYWGAPFTEYGACCPSCHKDDIRKILCKCAICGEEIFEDDEYTEAGDGNKWCAEHTILEDFDDDVL